MHYTCCRDLLTFAMCSVTTRAARLTWASWTGSCIICGRLISWQPCRDDLKLACEASRWSLDSLPLTHEHTQCAQMMQPTAWADCVAAAGCLRYRIHSQRSSYHVSHAEWAQIVTDDNSTVELGGEFRSRTLLDTNRVPRFVCMCWNIALRLLCCLWSARHRAC